MIRINVQQVLKAHAEKAKGKELPVIRIGKPAAPSPQADPPAVKIPKFVKSTLVQSLWIEYNSVLLERNKLSTAIAHMVERGADQEELLKHYERIESFRPQLQDLYDKIKYAEQHGTLPPAPEVRQDPETLDGIKLHLRSLIDKRSKLKSKIDKKKSCNPAKYAEWDQELAQVNVQIDDLVTKKKTLERKA